MPRSPAQTLRRLPSALPLALLAFGLALHAATAGADLTVPSLPARAYLLIETRSDTVLAAHNAEARLPPASLTKLMTAYLLFAELRAGRLALDERVTVSARAAVQPGARMFLRAGESVTVGDLLKGMLVQSGNDATVALVERVAPEPGAFVARMNAEAARLGLVNTHFTNVIGLQNAEHYSTARDLTHLAAALKRDFPEHAGLFALREFTWAGIRQPNRNTLLRDPLVNGLKTGHTGAAGYCLVASAERDGQQLIATVLGSDSEAERARAGRALLDFGARHFETRTLYTAGQALTRLRVWQGEADAVELGAAHALVLTLPHGAFETLSARAELPVSLQAPVARGAALGQLTLSANGRDIAQLPLVALAEVPPGSLAKRAADRLRLWWGSQAQAQAAP